jgi:hypothetical protein
MLWRTVRPGGADCPQCPRGQSGQVPRTIRKDHADRPARSHGPSVKANRTTRTNLRKTDRPRRPGGPSAWVPDCPLLKLGPSANRLQRKPKTKPDQMETNQEHEEHHMNSARADRPPPPRGQSALREQTQKQPDLESQHLQSITGSPKL